MSYFAWPEGTRPADRVLDRSVKFRQSPDLTPEIHQDRTCFSADRAHLQHVAAGDLAEEVRCLGATVQPLGQAVEAGIPDEATLSPRWLDVLSALEAYLAAIEAEGFWK